jgi:hypothetical protein
VSDDTDRVWTTLAATALAVAGLTCLTYAGWVVTARRALFADIAEATTGDAAVSLSAARSSDALAAGWSTAATLLGAGLLGVVAGSTVAATGGADPTEAGRAAVGCAVLGTGFLLTALGLLAGAAGLLLGRRAPYLGYAGWSPGRP